MNNNYYVDSIFDNLNYTFNKHPFIPHITGVISSTQIHDIYDDQFDANVKETLEFKCNLDNVDYFEDDCKNNNEMMMNYEFIGDECKATYRFFFLECAVDANALFLTDAYGLMKLWVNYKLFTVLNNSYKNHVIKLNKGINIIVIEIPKANKNDCLFLRISDYKYEKNNKKSPCLLQGNLSRRENYCYTFHSGNHLYNGEKFKFTVFPNHDVLGKRTTAELKIVDSFTKQTLLKKRIKVGKKHEIDLSGFKINNYDQGNRLIASIKYIYKNKQEHSEYINLYTEGLDNMFDYICKKAEEKLQEEELTEYDKLSLKQGIEYVKEYGTDFLRILIEARILSFNIRNITTEKHNDITIYQPGFKRIFFFNKMYNAVNYYNLYLPPNYSKNKKYPLIINHSVFEYSDIGKIFKFYASEPVIVADISGRGVLLGSYIGEAAINIALEDLFNRFNIDKTRIYNMGYSNGGGAAWAQLEAYPDIFAGGYMISGQPNCDLLCNLENIKLIYLSSTTERLYNISYKKASENLNNHPDNTGILGDYYTHRLLNAVHLNKYIIDDLLVARNNPYPNHIKYKTLRNRHRKAYWLKIHSIDNCETEGSIEADVIDNLISVKCKGITGFTIMVPPQIDKEYFEVIINSKDTFAFECFNKEEIHFEKSLVDEEIYYTRKSNYTPIIDLHKGSGLLDVFFDPLSIIVPNDRPEDIESVAKAYSEPYCSGFIPKLYIKYPIKTYEELLKSEDISERSYVVIDDGSEHPLLTAIRDKANIKINIESWVYKNTEYRGKCCVHQIVNSPWNPARNIHLISYNDKDLLNRDLFARKVIIPTYANGRHSYWNNDALIFNGKQFYGILDYISDPAII